MKLGTNEGKATFHSFRVNYIDAVVKSGSDFKTIMTLARHGSARMSTETCVKPRPERYRAAVEAVSEGVERSVSEVPCRTFVEEAAGAEGGMFATPTDAACCAQEGLATPTGFESTSTVCQPCDTPATDRRQVEQQQGVDGVQGCQLATPPRHPKDTSDATDCSAFVPGADLPPDLAEIVSAWPKLPEHIRAAVRALFESTGQAPRGGDDA